MLLALSEDKMMTIKDALIGTRTTKDIRQNECLKLIYFWATLN